MYSLAKTEYVCEDDSDSHPQAITKEIPFVAIELAKLRKDFARTARESETEYVWRVSLSGGADTGPCCWKGKREGTGAGIQNIPAGRELWLPWGGRVEL